MKKRIVVVGAGLGGCFVAHGLAESCDVTVVELGSTSPLLQDRVKDTATPAVTYPHITSGFGGTTQLWHNGLIEIDDRTFSDRWPFPKGEMRRYYDEAFLRLSGRQRSQIEEGAVTLRQKYKSAGFREECFGAWLFYPKKRVNPWHSLKLERRVRWIEGEVTGFEADASGKVRSLTVAGAKDGNSRQLAGDVFVLAAGGLGTPPLLQSLGKLSETQALAQAGFHYEDHPCATIGELTLDEPLYKLWNYPCAGGNLRLPLILNENGLQISFQLRPAAIPLLVTRNKRVKSVISDLRNRPLDPRGYFRLLTHVDDIVEIFSFKLNINLPTRHYAIIMVAEQPPSRDCAVWSQKGRADIFRKWELGREAVATYQSAIQKALKLLGAKVISSSIYPDWTKDVFSSSHHSGTARMSRSPEEGVCDGNGRVFGTENLYVCDGSTIPGTGIANTGLTIAALGLRLAEHLRKAAAPE